jgi:hypothetical protein
MAQARKTRNERLSKQNNQILTQKSTKNVESNLHRSQTMGQTPAIPSSDHQGSAQTPKTDRSETTNSHHRKTHTTRSKLNPELEKTAERPQAQDSNS